jgi:sec-independent protein translocase protein TatC
MGVELRHQIPPDEDDDSPREGRMGFLEHLDELRKRIIRSCAAIGIGMTVAFFFVDRIADFVLAPTIRALPPGSELIYTRSSEAFSFYLDVAFIAPGLYANEKRFAVPFVLLAAIGTVCGAMFSHYVLFPGMMTFFATLKPPYMKFMPRVEDNFDQYMKLLIGMVIVFQMPTLVFFLAKLRLVTARFLWRHIKYAILGSFIAGALLTSSADPWNQAMFAAPMILLYVISIGIAWLVGPKRSKELRGVPSSTTLRLVIGAMVVDQARKATSRQKIARGRVTRLM